MVSWEDLDKLSKSVNTVEEYEKLRIGTDFASKVIKARQKINITQAELAKRSGLKQSAISRIENQGSLPRIDTVYKIAQALDLDIDFYPKDLGKSLENQFQFEKLNEKINNLELIIKDISNEVYKLNKQTEHTNFVYGDELPEETYKNKSHQADKYIGGFIKEEQGPKADKK
jgi:transcriptional regulator with XRE-family HTH domain